MDEKFLEFWGSLLLNLSKGQKQSDAFFRWMRMGSPDFKEMFSSKGAPGFEELSVMFQKLYGLDQISKQSDEYRKVSEKAAREFQNSFKEYLTFTGLVPKKDHLELVAKYEDLKARCAGQEETIQHLRMLLAGRETDQADVVDQFKNMVKTQSDLFQHMVKEVGQYFKMESENKDEPEKGRTKNDEHDGSKPGV
jgi:hypothetical protein